MTLSQKYYDLGQWIIRVFVPAFITLYLGIDALVNLPKENEVTGVTALLATFLGVLLASSSRSFKRDNEADGGYFQIKGIDDLGRPHLGLDVSADPAALMGKKTITLKIDKPPVLETSTSADVEVVEPTTDNRPPWEKGSGPTEY